MINRQSMWFLTLFSLIIVLSVYYMTIDENVYKDLEYTKEIDDDVVVKIVESEYIMALQIESEREKLDALDEYEMIISNIESTPEEKSAALTEIELINKCNNLETTITTDLKEIYNTDIFVKIRDDKVYVVMIKDDHDKALANEIMVKIQSYFDDTMNVTVEFK